MSSVLQTSGYRNAQVLEDAIYIYHLRTTGQNKPMIPRFNDVKHQDIWLMFNIPSPNGVQRTMKPQLMGSRWGIMLMALGLPHLISGKLT